MGCLLTSSHQEFFLLCGGGALGGGVLGTKHNLFSSQLQIGCSIGSSTATSVDEFWLQKRQVRKIRVKSCPQQSQ